ncbi:Cysteine-rich RLK (receptor-like protein kinase) 8 [Cucumis melo var. makuwa]|uniref:Cysteine-rich RLK (Receptor-like protein kinase) 8 n=1 Tax=Cucumis melo var. makuwa TaxID=1194695 RepID=A0A5D3CW28_CUCMM|nr:Cysteine-rich RLK (receptor-like protein kinase) 8 [Cucumis melo var. makuwa]
MVSKQSNNETLKTNLGETQIEIRPHCRCRRRGCCHYGEIAPKPTETVKVKVWKTLQNLTSQPSALVQDSEPPQGQGHTRKLDEYNPSLDIPIALRKGTKSYTKHPICNYVSYDNLSPQFRAFTASLNSTIIPKNIYTTLECPEWKNVVMEEMKALEKNRTWEICALPKGHKTVGCKCVFSLKYKAYGTLDRHKARPCGGSLHEPPLGFEAQFGQQVCKLQKSLYGLKQSPRVWFDRFTTFVESQGYSQGHFDHTLFIKVPKTGKIVVLIVYVDDVVLTVDDQTEISQLKPRMGDEFEMKDLENLKYFLGMEVARSKEGIFVSQRKYTLDLPTETSMLGCHPVDTFIKFNCKLGNSDDQVPVDKELYQRLVASLCKLPIRNTWKLLTNSEILEKYSCYCTFVWGDLVTWRSKKQSVVAKSCAEAKYRAMIVSIVDNPIQHDRTKHVEIDWHFIKERLDSGSICILYIPLSQQVVDVLTKGLLRPHFDLCVSKLGLVDIYIPT